MNVMACTTDVCPLALNSKCVFYESFALPYTGIATNDSLQIALQKIELAIEGIITGGGGGGSIWGGITGTITNQTDLITYLSGNYVPQSRILTINGQSFDLTANRTWNVGTLLSASNGLTPVGTDVQLGGVLTSNVSINTNTFNLDIEGNSGESGIQWSNNLMLFTNINRNMIFNVGAGGSLILTNPPPNNNAVTQILGRNSVTGAIEYKDTSSFIVSPAGSDTQIQFNNAGVFGADADLTFTGGNTLNTVNFALTGTVSANGSVGTTGQVLTSNGASPATWTSVSGVIGGSIATGQVAFASGVNTLAGDADLTFTGGNTLNATNIVVSTLLNPSYLSTSRIPYKSATGLSDGAYWDNTNTRIGIGVVSLTDRVTLLGGTNTTVSGTTAYGGIQFVGNTDSYVGGITINRPATDQLTHGGIFLRSTLALGTSIHLSTTNNFGVGMIERIVINPAGNLFINTTPTNDNTETSILVRQSDGEIQTRAFSSFPQGTITGTGVANRVAIWDGPSSQTSDADLTFTGTTLTTTNLTLSGTPATDNTNTNILARDSVTGAIELRTNISTLTNSGAANEVVKSDGTNIVGTGMFTAGANLYTVTGNYNLTTTGDAILATVNGVGVQSLNANNAVAYGAFTINHQTTGTPGVGIGTGLLFVTETSASNNETGSIIQSISTNVGVGTEAFDLVFRNMTAGTAAAEVLRVTSGGTLVIPIPPNVDNTNTNVLTIDGSGNIEIRNNIVSATESGTYTPTYTIIANVDAVTAYTCQYYRVGSVVTVSGKVDIDATAVATAQVRFTLPIASDLSTEEQLAGTVGSTSGTAAGVGALRADITNNAAFLGISAAVTNNQSYFFIFSYLIVAV